MSDINITDGHRLAVIRNKLALWRGTHYDAELDIRIADVCSDDAMKERATNALKIAMKAIDLLESEIAIIEAEMERADTGESQE